MDLRHLSKKNSLWNSSCLAIWSEKKYCSNGCMSRLIHVLLQDMLTTTNSTVTYWIPFGTYSFLLVLQHSSHLSSRPVTLRRDLSVAWRLSFLSPIARSAKTTSLSDTEMIPLRIIIGLVRTKIVARKRNRIPIRRSHFLVLPFATRNAKRQ